MTTRYGNTRRGSTLIWMMAVDWGCVQLVKTELRRTADAAARYAAPALGQGIAAVRARAKDVAEDNTADGRPVVLADADVEQGRWEPATKTFVPNGTPADAIRMTARRAGPDAVPLMFARVLGRDSVDVSASAVFVAPAPAGFSGLDGITIKNNTFIGSYDSSVLTEPRPGHFVNAHHRAGRSAAAMGGPTSAATIAVAAPVAPAMSASASAVTITTAGAVAV
jgi:hypothetical protein